MEDASAVFLSSVAESTISPLSLFALALTVNSLCKVSLFEKLIQLLVIDYSCWGSQKSSGNLLLVLDQ